MQDIFQEARDKIGPGLIHSFFNSHGSYTRGGRYWILSPLRPDGHVGSFSIDESTGVYHDKSNNEGGDFIDLVAKARGVEPLEAAKMIIRESGGIVVDPAEDRKRAEKAKKVYPDPIIIHETDTEKQSIAKRVTDPWVKENWGKAGMATLYRNAEGQGVFYIVRFEKEKQGTGKRSKNDILFYLAADGKWYSHWHEKLKPFPLLGIDKALKNRLPCLVVEGEKCAKISVPGYNIITWLGGTSNMNKSDWGKLRGRAVTIWPDADSAMDKNNEYFLPPEQQAGMKAAHYIKSVIPQAKILEIYRHKPIKDNPAGWDIADYMDGVDEGEDVTPDPVQFIKDYTPYKSLSVEIDPYSVYKAFIDDYYSFDGLEQVNGDFWHYREDLHYWQRVMRKDLDCNLQRWMEETGLQWTISKSADVKVTSFINEVKQYLDRHSMGYFNKNPFIDAAMSPYIHVKNGSIMIDGDGNSEWHSRDRYDESFFKSLSPINCIDINFSPMLLAELDPARDCPAFLHFIKDVIPRYEMEKAQDKDALILESLNFFAWIIAYALSPIKPNEYFFGLYGGQRTGKTFFMDILKSIIGEQFCVERPVSELTNQFSTSGFWGKKVYIDPDLETRQPLPGGFIKARAGETSATVEGKNEQPKDGVKLSMAMFFVSNYDFHVKGIEGIERRFIMVPYKNKRETFDVKLLDKILGKHPHGEESGEISGKKFDERPAILALAIKAWKTFCTDDNYLARPPKWAAKDKDIWLLETNSVEKFLDENYFSVSQSGCFSRTEVYESYKAWCEDEGRKPLGKKNFYEEVRRNPLIKDQKLGGIDQFRIDEKAEKEEEQEVF